MRYPKQSPRSSRGNPGSPDREGNESLARLNCAFVGAGLDNLKAIKTDIIAPIGVDSHVEKSAVIDAANGSITSLLAEFGHGNRTVESEIVGLVYSELRRLASAHMRRGRGDHTLQATALVHETRVRLSDGPNIVLQSRAHFFAIASHHMRHILVDHARKRSAVERGDVQQQITLQDYLFAEQRSLVDVLMLNEALERLKTRSESLPNCGAAFLRGAFIRGDGAGSRNSHPHHKTGLEHGAGGAALRAC